MSLLKHRPLLWTRRTLIRDLGAHFVGASERDFAVDETTIFDFRVGPGSMFIPVPRADGAALSSPRQRRAIDKAISNGAAVALTTEALSGFSNNVSLIQVRNLREALLGLAKLQRRRFDGDLVAITGSVGKTTTKELLASVLSYSGGTFSTTANDNELETIAACLCSLSDDAPFAVVELCMIKPGSVARKAELAEPGIAVITNIGQSHGAHHSDSLSIYREKLGLLSHLGGRRVAVMPSDIVAFDAIQNDYVRSAKLERLVTVGSDRTDSVQLLSAQMRPTHSTIEVDVDGRCLTLSVPQAGTPPIKATLLALGVATACGLDVASLAPCIANWNAPIRRMQRFRLVVKKGGQAIEFIDDSYNASPDSVRALLDHLALRRNARRKVLILGDMFELPNETDAHLSLGADVAKAGVDLLIAVGPLAALTAQTVASSVETRVFDDTEAAGSELNDLLQPLDLVAAKASHGMRFDSLLEALKRRGVVCRKAAAAWTVEDEATDQRHH